MDLDSEKHSFEQLSNQQSSFYKSQVIQFQNSSAKIQERAKNGIFNRPMFYLKNKKFSTDQLSDENTISMKTMIKEKSIESNKTINFPDLKTRGQLKYLRTPELNIMTMNKTKTEQEKLAILNKSLENISPFYKKSLNVDSE